MNKHIPLFTVIAAFFAATLHGAITESVKVPFALEIDAVNYRYRLVATTTGPSARYDINAMLTFYEVPMGAAITIRTKTGRVLNVHEYSPWVYNSNLPPTPSYKIPNSPGPISEWFDVVAITQRMEARKTPSEWCEFRISFDPGLGSPVVSPWVPIPTEVVRRWIAE